MVGSAVIIVFISNITGDFNFKRSFPKFVYEDMKLYNKRGEILSLYISQIKDNISESFGISLMLSLFFIFSDKNFGKNNSSSLIKESHLWLRIVSNVLLQNHLIFYICYLSYLKFR